MRSSILVLALLLLLAAGQAAAQSRPAYLYPLHGDGLKSGDLESVDGSLRAAFLRTSNADLFRLAGEPPASCGPAAVAQTACLARLAGRGVVLRGIVKRVGSLLSFSLTAIDAQANLYNAPRLLLDPEIDNPGLLVNALEALRSAIDSRPAVRSAPPPVAAAEPMGAPVAKPKAVAEAPRTTPLTAPRAASPAAPLAPPPAASRPPSPATPQAAIVSAAPPPPAAPRAAIVSAAPPPPVAPRAAIASNARAPSPATSGGWMVPTGRWVAGGGLALLAGGGAAGFLGNRLSDRLTQKYAAHTLTAADRSSYRAVHNYATVANVLLIAGGVVTATGLVLWAAAPDAGGEVGVRGRF